MTAIDEASSEAASGRGMLVEMHLGGVLVEPGSQHVVGLFHRHAVDMVDPLAGLVILQEMCRTREAGVVIFTAEGVEPVELRGIDGDRQVRDHGLRRR